MRRTLPWWGWSSGPGCAKARDRRADPPKAVKGVVADGGMGPFMDALPREMRREIGDILRDRAEGLVPNRTALVAEFDAMLDIMKTEPFDRARLEAVLDTQRERVTERVMAGRTVVLDQIEAMSPSERAAFVERLEASLARAVEDARRSPPERRDD